ncbi:acetolactate synthase [Sulfitobacter sp. SK012]|nr:acetolactate synthase [Sulfitobacter sp. SK012]
MLGSDILVEMLELYGVEHIFGVPGDTNVPLYTALQRRVGNIEQIMCRDERSAGYMADAYARISNKVGVFEAPSGAGAMYSLPPVAEAHASSVPVILMTIDVPLPGEGRGVITELDTVKLFEPVTKASIQTKSPEKIPEIIRRAFRIATTGKPGAVHIVIPEDMLLAEVPVGEFSLHGEEECKSFPAYPTMSEPGKVEALVNLIDNAKRPLLIAGGGANRSQARAELRRFAEQMNIPVVTTITGQSTMPDNHPLAIGVIGDNGYHPHANMAMEEADLLVYLGSKVGSVVSIGWSFPSHNPDRLVAQVDIDPQALSNVTNNTLSIAGDVRLVLGALTEAAKDHAPKGNVWIETLNGYRTEFWEGAEPLFHDTTLPLRPEPVVRAFSERLTHPVNILSDAGTPTPYMTRFLRMGDTDSTFIIPRAYGGLGYAIPAVVGAWKAEPEKAVIGLFGDGSFNMSVGELETLVRLNCPATLIQFNNGCFGWIKGLQRMQGRGVNDCYSVDFTKANAAAIAESFGLKSWRVQTLKEFERAFDAALLHDGPCFIDVIVESLAERIPPVFSWLKKTGRDPLSLTSESLPF